MFNFDILHKGKPQNKLLLIVPNRDASYVNAVRPILNKYFSSVLARGALASPAALKNLIRSQKFTHIATTELKQMQLIDPLVEGNQTNNVGLKLYLTAEDGTQVPILQLPPLRQYYTTNHGGFLLDHFSRKLTGTGMDSFIKLDSLDWEHINGRNFIQALSEIDSSWLVAVDIETSQDDLKITRCSYTAAVSCNTHPNGFRTKTYVINFTDQVDAGSVLQNFDWLRKLNNTSSPKVMQNGRYDCTYFLRFDAPIKNYIYDTYNLFHCLFAELPKTLEFQSAFLLDNFKFWHSGGGDSLSLYNAKDTHNTFWTWLALVDYCSRPGNEYAFTNYLTQFPVVFPCIHMGMDGLAVDEEVRRNLRVEAVAKREAAANELEILTGIPEFNASSPRQVVQLINALGFKAASSDAKVLQRFAHADPLYARIKDAIENYRGAVKAIGTYYDFELLNGRLMYSLDPAGTDTGRMASRGSNFWCGTQIQNMPYYSRGYVVADPGTKLIAVDKAQAESYCTGFISGDKALIESVTTSPDFHCTNVSLMFGIPFEQLYDVATGKRLNIPIRELGKRVNHGANYNMGHNVLRETMGDKNVAEARTLLNLPPSMSLDNVCKYLLGRFDSTYPDVRGRWQDELKKEVRLTGKLETDDGWVRRTFMRPWENKDHLNSLVSHKPQGFSARLVNQALMQVWLEFQLGKYRGKFRLKAQVHDEIIATVCDSLNPELVAKEVADIMVIPTRVTGGGVTRTMSIPSTYKVGSNWAEVS